MVWVMLDDGCASHPKILRAGPDGFSLWVAGMCHCNRHATNGRIDKDLVQSLYPPLKKRAEVTAKMLASDRVRLWDDHGDHYMVHDYIHYQELAMKELVEAKKAAARERKRAQRERDKSRDRGVTFSVTQDAESSDRDVTATMFVTCDSPARVRTRDPVPSRPVPSRPVHTEEDLEQVPASSAAVLGRRWLSDASGRDDFDHMGRWNHAFEQLAGKPPSELEVAQTTLRRAFDSKLLDRRRTTPQHVLDYWATYATGETPRDPVKRDQRHTQADAEAAKHPSRQVLR